MSGILGVIRFDGEPVVSDELQRMANKMAYRGPDGWDYWTDGLCGLGQGMLCSTPESVSEQLPWQDPASGLVITADARIDNRKELISSLGVDNSYTDSQLILYAYRRWGEACVQYLLGDFAFAIWDGAKLFLARDHLGCRPLYYASDARECVFASSDRPVAEACVRPLSYNYWRLVSTPHERLAIPSATESFFDNVFKLPPASVATWVAGHLTISCYWKPQPKGVVRENDGETIEALEEVLTRAVARRMRSHRPVGSMLSGGLDSSLIVALARNLPSGSGSHLLPVFSGYSDDELCVESTSIRAVASQGRVDCQRLRATDVEAWNVRLDQALKNIEHPADSYMVLPLLMALMAKESGCGALLDGVDGDMVMSLPANYPAYFLKEKRWKLALQEFHALSENYYQGKRSTARLLGSGALHYLMPERFRGWLRTRSSISAARELLANSVYRQGGVVAKGVLRRAEAAAEVWAEDARDSLDEACIQRMESHQLRCGIECYERLGSYCGIELRHPYADKELIEFSLALPWRLKSQGGWSKYGLRLLAQKHLPMDVAWRRGWEHLGWNFNMARFGLMDSKLRGLAEQEIVCSQYLDKTLWQSKMEQWLLSRDEGLVDSVFGVYNLGEWMHVE
ncbi:MAG: asparagine synthase-related protein [Pseudomonadales bacterium]